MSEQYDVIISSANHQGDGVIGAPDSNAAREAIFDRGGIR